MSLVPIILVAAILAVDGGLEPLGARWNLDPAAVIALTLGPVAMAFSISAIGIWWCDKRLTLGKSRRAFIHADRLGRIARTFIVTSHLVSVLVLGWLGTVRSVVGDPVLLDEIIALLPAVLGLIGTWWAYYPIDRRLHEALLIRQLDEGRPVYPTLTRSAFVLMQARLHLLLVLVPVLLIAGCTEVIGRATMAFDVNDEHWIVAVAKVVVGASVFMIAPLLARVILDVKPMPLGTLREALLEVCRRHCVKIRELLIWHTNGSVFNAAVMGITGRLRYVMITDALLETMHENQVRAVMAHEIGHVRRRHLPWMAVTLIACFIVVQFMVDFTLYIAQSARGLPEGFLVSNGAQHAAAIVGVGLSFMLFGWVCRRFERQADTFAVQHLSQAELQAPNVESRTPIHDPRAGHSGEYGNQLGTETAAAPRFRDGDVASPSIGQSIPDAHPSSRHPQSVVSASAVHTMCDALESIAYLNGIDLQRKSWRHGSIAWRRNYLLSLIGRPIDELPIDKLVVAIKLTALLVVVAAVALAAIEYVRVTGATA